MREVSPVSKACPERARRRKIRYFGDLIVQPGAIDSDAGAFPPFIRCARPR
jgi:hypothetical protein